MPTDLTGTPTSLGIGTYNVDADAPSGLGFNAAMAQIDALLSARVTTPGGIVAGEAMVWNGTGWVRSSVTQITANGIGTGIVKSPYRKVSSKAVSNSVAETDLLNGEITLAGNTLGASGAARLTLFGNLINNSGATQALPRFKLKLGATTIIDSGAPAAAWAASATQGFFQADALIANVGATNSQWSKLNVQIANSLFNNIFVTPTTGLGIYGTGGNDMANGVLGGSSTEDTTANKALAFTVTLPVANAGCGITLLSAFVEIL